MTKRTQPGSLPTLALAGSLRPGHEESDRAWLKTITESERPEFDSLDDSTQGVRVAWRKQGSAPEYVNRGYSQSGVEQILLAGRSEIAAGSTQTLLDDLDLEEPILSVQSRAPASYWRGPNRLAASFYFGPPEVSALSPTPQSSMAYSLLQTQAVLPCTLKWTTVSTGKP